MGSCNRACSTKESGLNSNFGDTGLVSLALSIWAQERGGTRFPQSAPVPVCYLPTSNIYMEPLKRVRAREWEEEEEGADAQEPGAGGTPEQPAPPNLRWLTVPPLISPADGTELTPRQDNRPLVKWTLAPGYARAHTYVYTCICVCMHVALAVCQTTCRHKLTSSS